MLKKLLALFLCATVFSASALFAGNKKPEAILITEKNRNGAGDYAVTVVLGQRSLQSSFDLGRVARPPAGGLLDSIIIYSLDDKKERLGNSARAKAELTVAPLREALTGFDVGALALASTDRALSAPGWFRKKSIAFTQDGASVASAGPVAKIIYRYEVSADFSNLRVFADVSLKNGPIVKDGKSNGSDQTQFRQVITSIVQLRKRSYEGSENVSQWSADQGKLGKAALQIAFTQIEEMLPLALNMSAGELKIYQAKTQDQGFAAGYNGAVVKRGGVSVDDILIWSDGLIKLHTLP